MNNRRTLSLTIPLALCLAALVAMLTLVGRSTHAAGSTRYVATNGTDSNGCTDPNNPCRTVQYAVDAAGEGDVIKVAAGTYTDVHTRPVPAGYPSPPASDIITQVAYLSKTVTLRGGYTTTNSFAEPPDPDLQPTVLDAQGQGRVFYLTGRIAPVIAGLEMTGGNAARLGGSPSGDSGGGMLVVSATLTMSECRVYSNTATFGGGLCLYESASSTLSDNVIRANVGETQTAGIYVRNSPRTALLDNTIEDNKAQGTAGRQEYAGVQFVSSHDAVLIGNVIIGNQANDLCGGLCFRESRNALLRGNLIAGNSSGLPGFEEGRHAGGILFIMSDGAEVIDNRILNNSTYGNGAGVYVERSAITLTNNIVADNVLSDGIHFTGSGSGLWLAGDTFRLLHNTIARNTGDDGSGVYVTDIFGSSGRAIMTNTILVSHTVGITVTAGNTATLEATLWGTGTWANETDLGGDGTITVMPPNIWDDPGFVDPDNGDYHIGAGSAAVNAGIDAGVSTDIDGDPRPDLWYFDIGADELLTSRPCIRSGVWVSETVDSAGDRNVGTATSLALEPIHPYTPHISYHDVTSDRLKYATLSNDTWFSETVDTGGDPNSLALAPNYPHIPAISYHDYWDWSAKYACHDGGNWTIMTIHRGMRVGIGGTPLALEPTYPYTPHISTYNPWGTSRTLSHSYLSGTNWCTGTWVHEQVEPPLSQAGWYNSLALEPSSPYTPHMSYYSSKKGDLRHAEKSNGTAWLTETVDSAGDVGWYTSLAMDSNRKPHVSYYDSTNADLKYTWMSGTNWPSRTVDSDGDVGLYTSFELDQADAPYVCYYDATYSDLKFAYFDGEDWISRTIDGKGDVGAFCSLALDPVGCPHISYYDATNGALKYAYLSLRIYLPIIVRSYTVP